MTEAFTSFNPDAVAIELRSEPETLWATADYIGPYVTVEKAAVEAITGWVAIMGAGKAGPFRAELLSELVSATDPDFRAKLRCPIQREVKTAPGERVLLERTPGQQVAILWFLRSFEFALLPAALTHLKESLANQGKAAAGNPCLVFDTEGGGRGVGLALPVL